MSKGKRRRDSRGLYTVPQRVFCVAMSAIFALGMSPLAGYASDGGTAVTSDGQEVELNLQVSGEDQGEVAADGVAVTQEEATDVVQGAASAASEALLNLLQTGFEPQEASEPAVDYALTEGEGFFDLQAQAALVEDDPFYFKDYETGKIVTTLHTSGTYELVKADGTPYTEWKYLRFDPQGSTARKNYTYSFSCYPKRIDLNGNDEVDRQYLEDLSSSYGARDVPLPSGLYRIRIDGDWLSTATYLGQKYRIVNDGVFCPKFENGAGMNYTESIGGISVKPYTEGKSDDDYDGYVYEDNGWKRTAKTPDLETFVLASDTRLRIGFESAMPLDEGTTVRLESIGLWRADGTIADYQPLGEGETDDDEASYRNMTRSQISRVDALGSIPSWPNYLNFNDDDKITYLWSRDDGGLDTHTTFYGDLSDGDVDEGTFIVDHANFTNVPAESGLYFPMVTATIGEETYVYACYPIEIDATGTAARKDPTVVTTSLASTRADVNYTATLKGRSGAKEAGTFSWAVTDGTLPNGLTLNAATGVISGKAAKAGVFNFTVTLTESVSGVERTGTCDLELRVGEAVTANDAFDHLSLGEIQYTPGTVWLDNHQNRNSFLDFTIPISLDVRDESLDLSETMVWYLVQRTFAWNGESTYSLEHELAANLMNEDGTALEIPVLIQDWSSSDLQEFRRLRVFLVPKHNDGNYAFDLGPKSNDGTCSDGSSYHVKPIEDTLAERYSRRDLSDEELQWAYTSYVSGDYAEYLSLPEMPYAALDNPDIQFGSWLHFPSLSFEGYDTMPTTQGRVRIWRYNGTTTPGSDMQTEYISQFGGSYGDSEFVKEEKSGATFKLAPGTYAFTVEGAVPVYDEFGQDTGKVAWVDIAGAMQGVQPLRGTHPKQYLVTVGPNEGTDGEFNNGKKRLTVGITYTGENITNENTHSVTVSFEQEDNSYAPEENAEFQVAWYRRTGADESTDALVATGENVSFGPSEYPLYVEITPTGRTAWFWKASGRQLVSDKNKVVDIKLPRKPLLTGTFELSCKSGLTPKQGDYWGILEVRTALQGGGYTTSNIWASSDSVKVPDLSPSSTITFTPSADLGGDAVSYTVPDDATADFTYGLEAPLMKGMITFEGLSFKDVDGTTSAIALDDGYTSLKVERLETRENATFTYATPYRLLNDSRIVLQPDLWYGGSYFDLKETTYRFTIVYRNPNTPARMGSNASEYAAKRVFEATLSPSKTAATFEAATLTSRGYASIELSNPGDKACTLLLYDGEGNFVEKGSVGKATQLRTPFLDAGKYTLYAVDSGRVPSSKDSYANIDGLYSGFRGYFDRISVPLEFTIEDGAATTLGDYELPNWTAPELINHSASSVTATASYTEKVTITMHAELNDEIELSDDAYLEIQTNQASNESATGYMNPDALNLNGKALSLNRWSGLFRSTQCMYRGSLEISLAEAKKIDSSCARFPLDMTLVIPRRNMENTEVSVWLVDGRTRSLVGTYHEDSQEISLVAPSVAAWQSFYVYGETAPHADVTVYVDGMRAASAWADSYGYYTAEITLPGDVEDFDEFTLTAASQWTRGEVGYAAVSEASTVTYSTTFPALERITLCYQSDPGGEYFSIKTYYRGKMPDKYATFYRSENENNSKEGDEHAKYFWIVEYANGDIIDSVDLNVPRSDGSSVSLRSTEKLQTAEAWIPDVRMKLDYSDPRVLGGKLVPTSATGGLVRDALESDELRAFVTMPEYFSYSPDELNSDINLKEPGEDVVYEMQGATDLGRFEGCAGDAITQEELSAYLSAMANTSYARLCTDEDAAMLANLAPGQSIDWDKLSSSDEVATALKAAGNNAAGWILVGLGVREVDGKLVNPLLRVRYETTTVDQTPEQLAAGIKEIMDGAQPAIDSYEGWAIDGKDQTVTTYKGYKLWGAVGSEILGDESCRYFIITGDGDTADSNVQVEMLTQYYIETEGGERTGKYMYQYSRMDKSSLKRIVFDELNGQRTEATLTIASDQVYDGKAGAWDVCDQWSIIHRSINEGFNAGTLSLAGKWDADVDMGGGGLYGQSEPSVQFALTTQGLSWPSLPGDPITSEVAGYNISNGIVGIIDYVWPGKQTDEEVQQEIQNGRKAEGLDDLDPAKLAKRHEKGYIKDKFDRTMNHMRNPIENAAGNVGAMAITGGVAPTTVPAVIYGQGVPANNKCFWKWYNGTFGVNPPGWFEDPEDVKNIRTPSNLDKALHNYTRLRTQDILKPGSADWKSFYKHMDAKTLAWCQQKYLINTGQWKKSKRPQNEGKHDPSGYVYEAVLSNRVEGATVTLYTYNPAAAAYGLDEATFTDSSQFGIEDNPQVTGADGRYQWFVPEGYWQVRVSKKGYEDFSSGDYGHQEEVPVLDDKYEQVIGDNGQPVYKTVWVGDYGIDATKDFDGDGVDDAASYWMPVLPVQLDVNIPLKSLEAPAIKSVEATSDGLVVTFTKYLQPETVTGAMFAVALADDGATSYTMGAVKPLDLEAAGDGNEASYASTFLVTASESAAYPAALTGQFQKEKNNLTVTLTDAAAAAKSYAGTPVSDTAAHAAVLDLTPRIASIDIANVWTKLSDGVPVRFTATISDARDGGGVQVSDALEISQEEWTCDELNRTISSPNTYKLSARSGYSYRYSITLAAKSGYLFSDNLALSYGGTPLAAGSYTASVSEDGTSVTITGLVADVMADDGAGVIDAIHITGATLSYSAGDKPKFTATLDDENLTFMYEVFFGEVPDGKGGTTQYILDNEGDSWGEKALEAFASEGSYTDWLMISGPTAATYAGDLKVYLDGKLVTGVAVDVNPDYPNEAVITLPVTVSAKAKAANPITATAKARSMTYQATKKVLTNPLTVTKNQGKVTYALASQVNKSGKAVKYFTVNKTTGKITAKAKTPAGSYTLKIKATAAGNASYNAGSVTKSVKMTVNKAAAKKGTTAKTLKASSLKKKAASFSIKPVTDGKVSYKVAGRDISGKLSFSAKTGKVTVTKGTPKGTYTMQVKISAKAGKNYKALKAKTYKITVKVK